MHKLLTMMAVFALGTVLTGCTRLIRTVDLNAVAKGAFMKNVTTGDGEFGEYTATGYVAAKDVGIAIGIPFIAKFFEVYPSRSNEELMTDVAMAAKGMGADAMINVTPTTECYCGFPFIFIGFYVDKADGTGIKTKEAQPD